MFENDIFMYVSIANLIPIAGTIIGKKEKKYIIMTLSLWEHARTFTIISLCIW